MNMSINKNKEEIQTPLLSEYKSKPRDEESSRSFNDVLFGVLFFGCCVGMGVISTIAFARGDPIKLIPSYEKEYHIIYGNFVEAWLQDAVAQAKMDSDILACSVALAVLLGFIWIQLIKIFTKLFIYLSLTLGVAAVVALGGYFLKLGFQQHDEKLQVVGYVLFGLAVISLLAVIFLRKKVDLTCAMFKEACRGVQYNPALFLVSAIVVIGFLAFVVYWVASFIYLYSIPGDSINPGQPPKFDERIRNLMFFMLFGFFWVSAMISAIFQHSVAGAVSTWYFSRDAMSARPRGSPALKSLLRAVTTSFGSLALGSLLIAIVEFMNLLLQLTKMSHSKNRLVVFVVSCAQCLLGCIEGILRYVNKFAYIYVAMHGHSFFKASRECFDLISRNLFNSVITDVISGFVLFMGKILFTAVSTMLMMGIVENLNRELSIVTLFLTVVISFTVLHIISHVIGVGVNTVFVCYLEDLELNKGTNMYVSPDVHQKLQESLNAHRSTSHA